MTIPLKKRSKLSDETFVWFTSMGLSVGLVMVLGLLYLVVANGARVFWPNDIVKIELKNTKVIGGEISKKIEKAHSTDKEWQLFVANKDIYGYSFKYVDEKDIKAISYPHDLISLERMEYGDAIGFARFLTLKNNQELAAGSAAFDKALKGVVRDSEKRRRAIYEIEKVKIGAINREMESLRLEQKSLKPSDSAASGRVSKKMQDLQAKYDMLSASARTLRNSQNESFLTYRLLTGEEKKLSTGQVVNILYPNKMNVVEKIAHSIRSFWLFLSTEPREANTEGGIFPAIFGTFAMTLLMSVAVTPFGVLAAIYLREYAKQGFFVRAVRIAVNNLAGVPSIVFGVFGLGFFVYFVGASIDQLFYSKSLPTPTFGTGGIIWAALTLALMTVPVVIVATEEALAAVSRGAREGSLACGASKWQTIQHVVLPASAPGILTGLILAMARGAGEVAPLMLVGVVKLAPTLPIDGIFPFVHLERKFMHLGFHIYDLGFQSPDSEAAKPMVFATTLLLILLVVLLNLSAIIIREKLRRKYTVGAF